MDHKNFQDKRIEAAMSCLRSQVHVLTGVQEELARAGCGKLVTDIARGMEMARLAIASLTDEQVMLAGLSERNKLRHNAIMKEWEARNKPQLGEVNYGA